MFFYQWALKVAQLKFGVSSRTSVISDHNVSVVVDLKIFK